MTLEEQLTGSRTPPRSAASWRSWECAGSGLGLTQAKGRVERLWGTFLDRLTSELRLAGASTREEAGVVLERYLGRHNRRFMVAPIDPTRAWPPWPKGRRPNPASSLRVPRSGPHPARSPAPPASRPSPRRPPLATLPSR